MTPAATLASPVIADPLSALEIADPVAEPAPVAISRVGGTRRRPRTRRTASRRARTAVAGVLRRAERWLRSGELEVDRL